MRIRLVAPTLAIVTVLAACGAPRSGTFTPIDRGRIPAPLTATTTTTTTTTTTLPSTTTSIETASTSTTVGAPPTTIVNELVRLYFIAGREQLVGIDVPLARPASVAQVMAVLEAGPTGDGAAGLRSAIPPRSQSTTSQDRGVITVDLVNDFFTNIEGPDQRLAIAQIVLTLTQLGGISQVKFTQNGEPIAVILSDGSSSEVGQALFEDDYSVLLDSNPPVATTTTATTSTITTTTTAPASETTVAPPAG